MSIRINDLTVRFKNGVVAVNKASLEIPKGIYGLLGENGAGKTTLMRVLTTVLKTNGRNGYDLEQRITYYLEKTSLTEHQNKKNAAIIWWYEETCRTHTGTS